jgi:two-component system chemotaxis response regulator CheY
MKALVIDDSKAIRSIVSRILKELHFEVVDAADGREGLSKLVETPGIELVLVDWNMPNMNGLEFVQAVRGDQRWKDLRLMMVTTETEVEQMTRALEAGANEYVMKPFTKDVILGKLQLLGLECSTQG